VRRAFQKGGYKGMVAWQIEHLEKRSASQYYRFSKKATASGLLTCYTSSPTLPMTSFTPTHATAL
jgi:hypothetical protein